MKRLALAILVLALLPQYSSQPAKHVKQQADSGKKAGESPAAITEVPSPPKAPNADSTHEASTHEDNPVRIAQPIAITTRPDYSAWVFSALLVCVGAFQAYLLFRTMQA